MFRPPCVFAIRAYIQVLTSDHSFHACHIVLHFDNADFIKTKIRHRDFHTFLENAQYLWDGQQWVANPNYVENYQGANQDEVDYASVNQDVAAHQTANQETAGQQQADQQQYAANQEIYQHPYGQEVTDQAAGYDNLVPYDYENEAEEAEDEIDDLAESSASQQGFDYYGASTQQVSGPPFFIKFHSVDIFL